MSGNQDNNKRKREAQDDNLPPSVRLRYDVDAMDALLMTLIADNQALTAQVNDRTEGERYLHRRCEMLDNYVLELEGRMSAMEAVIVNIIGGGDYHVARNAIDDVRQSRNYDTTDLDRIVEEAETEADEPDDIFFNGPDFDIDLFREMFDA